MIGDPHVIRSDQSAGPARTLLVVPIRRRTERDLTVAINTRDRPESIHFICEVPLRTPPDRDDKLRRFSTDFRVAPVLRLSSRRAHRLSGMSEHIYKKLELVGSSKKSIDDAVRNALSRASKTVRNMRWFEVIETRGQIEDNKIDHWQVTIKVGFTLDP